MNTVIHLKVVFRSCPQPLCGLRRRVNFNMILGIPTKSRSPPIRFEFLCNTSYRGHSLHRKVGVWGHSAHSKLLGSAMDALVGPGPKTVD
ncbi:uncharacterized protein QC763_0037440 [Podospora pseudopauciseta]|uniref:Uncharacterized protein n=1 Tax=Podospora pseudopauciseta TaxID=2093780 RepID=A0ABR0HPR8_9PEZI|nr:hypothetical protein QC763_0037440 [Podospora pseudopauciseta]